MIQYLIQRRRKTTKNNKISEELLKMVGKKMQRHLDLLVLRISLILETIKEEEEVEVEEEATREEEGIIIMKGREEAIIIAIMKVMQAMINQIITKRKMEMARIILIKTQAEEATKREEEVDIVEEAMVIMVEETKKSYEKRKLS